MLFKLWDAASHRATWDLDLLGRGMNTVAAVVGVFKHLCDMAANSRRVYPPADGEPALSSPYKSRMLEAGFAEGYRRLSYAARP